MAFISCVCSAHGQVKSTITMWLAAICKTNVPSKLSDSHILGANAIQLKVHRIAIQNEI